MRIARGRARWRRARSPADQVAAKSTFVAAAQGEHGRPRAYGRERARVVTWIGRTQDAPKLRHGGRLVCAGTTVCAFARVGRGERQNAYHSTHDRRLGSFGRTRRTSGFGENQGLILSEFATHLFWATIFFEVYTPSNPRPKNTKTQKATTRLMVRPFPRARRAEPLRQSYHGAYPDSSSFTARYRPRPQSRARLAPSAGSRCRLLPRGVSHGGDRWVFPYRTRAVARADAHGRWWDARDFATRLSFQSWIA